MAFAIPFMWIATPERQHQGIRLIVGSAQRIPAGSVGPRIKNHRWLDFVMGLLEAYERGAETVARPDADGNVTERPGLQRPRGLP